MCGVCVCGVCVCGVYVCVDVVCVDVVCVDVVCVDVVCIYMRSVYVFMYAFRWRFKRCVLTAVFVCVCESPAQRRASCSSTDNETQQR